ncbi:hypothetical protein BCR36DRAFT_453535 [Piromyces finnis]|uniref:Glycosyltransferase family 17 protein n=1 Tax=Piromyces finnis TaxID=1754191 RepID=A0A1Y1VM06_9FUNG|nr:hypothetical protein BCR36DRAFT_453535 [Piromyces finnis]|eukprot:ORX59156.1 hypothetical protein BCR36DRAFT_453535 [Piromyces finnis]
MKHKAKQSIKHFSKIHLIVFPLILLVLFSLGYIYKKENNIIPKNVNLIKSIKNVMVNDKDINIVENRNRDNGIENHSKLLKGRGNRNKKGKGKVNSKQGSKSKNKPKHKSRPKYNHNKNSKKKENKFKIHESYSVVNIIKKKPYYDRYGIDLNKYIIDGMINKAINNNTDATIEDWDLYTPPCPNLHPVHYSKDVLDPVCEDIALPFYKVTSKGTNFYNLPLTMRLNANMEELVNDDYHPFDYGYYKYEKNEDEDYYSKVVKSPMDEVPDPRRRRLFSMILFNSEFELLDLYLAEFYEIFDYFIIYESNSTFSGFKKPLYLTRTLLETNRYEKFRDKIIPVTLPVLELKNYNSRGPGFPREHLARREVIEKGLRAVNARHGDLFIHGDLDEVPRPRLTSYLKKCGGWEHLQMGIGGGPKPINNPNTKSYIHDKTLPVSTNRVGEYKIDYSLKDSIGFSIFFYEYSFHMIENRHLSNLFHPNIAIFDARKALGQYPKFNNDGTKFDINNIKHYSKRSYIENENEFENDEIENINEVDNEYDGYYDNKTENGSNDIEGNDEDENNDYENEYIDYRSFVDDENNDKEDNDYKDINEDEKRSIENSIFNTTMFDPYKGYSYSDNTNDDYLGKGFLGEFMRFRTKIYGKNKKLLKDRNMVGFWKSGWH